jgi:hypothetical protein
MKVSFGENLAAAWYQRKFWCAWEVKDDVYGFIMWWLSVGRY